MATHADRRWRWLAALALIVLTCAAFWPALGSYLVRDDFAQIAYARLLGTPWPLFFHDHFIPTGAFFRPLGFAFLWLTTAVAGTHMPGHYAVAMGLHALVGLTLWAVLRRVSPRPWLAWLLAAAFALNPLTIGTSLWLSDRFDLLAALFMLLTLVLGWDYRARGGGWRLVGLLACALLAMLAKETGLLVVAPLTLLWLGIEGRRLRLRVPVATMCALWAVPAVYLIWRVLVLGSLGGGGEIAAQSPWVLLWEGGGAWLAHLPGYLVFWPRLTSWQQIVAVAALAALAVSLAWQRSAATTVATQATWLLSGLTLFVLPATVQAPIAAISALPLSATMSPIDAAMQARLYYIALCGLVIAIAAACSRTGGRPMRLLQGAALLGLVVVTGLAARQLATHYNQRSQAIRPLAEAAVAAVERLPLPTSPCQIYMLGATQPPEWGRFAPFDSIVKARMPDLERVGNCLIQTNHAPYFYLLRRGTLETENIAPLQALPGQLPNDPLFTVGGLEVASLNLSSRINARHVDGFFFAWRGGRFHDVTDAVHAGERPVYFRCIRRPTQCPARAAADPTGSRFSTIRR